MRILSIDPGSRYCAMVVLDTEPEDLDEALVEWEVLDRRERGTVDRDLDAWIYRTTTIAALARARHSPDWTVVEEAGTPNPHVGMTNPTGIIETAHVVGAMVVALDAVIMPTGQYGAPVPNRKILLARYPSQLVGPRESTGSGKGIRQHARAAWDLAYASRTRLRTLTQEPRT